MVDRAAKEGFMNPSNKELIVSATTADELMRKMQNYKRPVVGKNGSSYRDINIEKEKISFIGDGKYKDPEPLL